MKSLLFLIATFALSTLGVATAHGDTFTFTFGTTANNFNGSGTLTGSLVAPGEYQITTVGGTTDTGNGVNRPIAGIVTAFGFEGNDNDLFESSAGVFSFDDLGLSYSLGNGAMINIFQDSVSAPGEILERSNGNFVSEATPYSVSAVTPEPGSFLLLATGLLGATGTVRRRLFA